MPTSTSATGSVRSDARPARLRDRLVRLASVGLLALAGCAQGSDAPVARVGTWALSQERLTDLLLLAQPLPLDSVTVAGLVDHWVAMSALAQRMAEGVDLDAPELVDASLWLERREAVLAAERTARLGVAASVSVASASREFAADSLVLLAHVLRRTTPATSEAERQLQKRTAQEILERLRAGGGWPEAVARSEDDETRDDLGLLGLVRREDLPQPLAIAASGLQPGQVSSVVESAQGFHVLYRPRFSEVESLYPRLLSERRLAGLDQAANRALLDSLNLEVGARAMEVVRALAGSPTPEGGSEPVLSWQGGRLSEDVVARHVAALPPDARARLRDADADAIRVFLDELVAREARLAGAARAGIDVDSETREALRAMHRRDVSEWHAALTGRSGAMPGPQDLDRYMEDLVARRVPLQPVPPLLKVRLLEGLAWTADARAIRNATETARTLLTTVTPGRGP
ncbi:MAG: peptidylprolyl isomerase [Gemmatimonadota bacterium]